MKCKGCGARGRMLTAPGPKCSSCHSSKESVDGVKAHANSVYRNYGVTGDEYYALLERQNGVCAICSEPPSEKRLSVDHDHRCCEAPPTCGLCSRSALLCFRCNTTLGKLENAFPGDNRKLLRLMLEYLDRTEDSGMEILWGIREKV